MIVAGDMGIGNTTSATAIICGIASVPASRIVGPGTGLDEAAIRRKASVIDDALRDLEVVPTDAFDVVSKVGGFEIAGIAGLFLGAAATRTAIVADGLISTAGTLVAHTLTPATAAFIFAGHRSSEPPQAVALERMELRPLLDLEMRLGEGTGATLATVILEAACRICSEMATFEEARVSKRLEGEIESEITEIFDSASDLDLLLVVSNEVGHGVVPATPLGRRYRDLIGLANQMAAGQADSVYWMVAGIPQLLKHGDRNVADRP